MGHRHQGILVEGELHPIQFKQIFVLPGQGVLGLGQDIDQSRLIQLMQGDDHRHTAYKLGNQAEFQDVVGLDLVEDLADILVLLSLDVGAEADGLLVQALFDDLFTSSEVKDMVNRWLLMTDLYKGKPQREIAEDRKLSLCKITRGSKMLKKEDGFMHRLLSSRYDDHLHI